MDILAHGLWTGLVAKASNRKLKRSLNVKWTIFWGVFPDLFAFAPPFAVLLYEIAIGRLHFRDWPVPDAEGSRQAGMSIFTHLHILYSLSHSLIVFFVIFLLAWLLLRRPVLEMLAWLLHILIDIPTHSYKFYPTPFLWPVSNLKVNGISWATPWFLILNYLTIIIVFLLLHRSKSNSV